MTGRGPYQFRKKLSRTQRPIFSELFEPDINDVLNGGVELLVIRMSRNPFLHSRYSRFEAYPKAERRVRFVPLDPTSAAVRSAEERYYAERARTAACSKIVHTLQLLAKLRRRPVRSAVRLPHVHGHRHDRR